MRLTLASASPRRAGLLRAAGLAFETLAVEVDERARPGEPAAAYVRRLAAEKATTAMRLLLRPSDDVVILGADTTVVVDDEILGKPRDDRDAEAMLRRLSGRRHDVITGVSVRTREAELGAVEATAVYWNELSAADVFRHVASGEGRDKAGGYAIQGLAARFVSRIEGSYSNVVGLPVGCVLDLLRRLITDRR